MRLERHTPIQTISEHPPGTDHDLSVATATSYSKIIVEMCQKILHIWKLKANSRPLPFPFLKPTTFIKTDKLTALAAYANVHKDIGTKTEQIMCLSPLHHHPCNFREVRFSEPYHMRSYVTGQWTILKVDCVDLDVHNGELGAKSSKTQSGRGPNSWHCLLSLNRRRLKQNCI